MNDFNLINVCDLYGLHPKKEHSGRVRFCCPECKDDSTSKKIKRTAHGWEESPCTWWCYRCNAKGFAWDIYKAHGDQPPQDDDWQPSKPKRIVYKKPVSKPHINVANGWTDLIMNQHDPSFIYNYCLHTRGWQPMVAKVVADLSDEVAWAFGKGTIANRAMAVDRPVCVALRDATGSVVNVSRRWAYDGKPSDGKPKAMVLSSKDTGGSQAYAGNMMCFGNIVEAIEVASDNPLYICEGAPDYLALEALINLGKINGAVVGAYNITTMYSVVDFIHQHLTSLGLILPRVIFVPHVNDKPLKNDTIGVGERTALNCAQKLVGRAGVYVAQIPAPRGVEGDVADLMRYRGVDETVACLATARLFAEPPVLISESATVIRNKMQSAVVRCASDKSMIVYQVDAGAGKSYSALGISADVATGKIKIKPNGTAKTDERSVVFATPSNALAEEKYKAFIKMFPDVPARMAYGAMHYCAFKKEVESEFAVLGRRGVCGIEKFSKTLCPNFHSCQGSKIPESKRGEVLFTSHAMSRNLKPDLTIIDEDCGIIETYSVAQSEIISLFGSNSVQHSVKKWLNVLNPDAPAGAFYFNKVASDALSANFTWDKSSQYDIRIAGEDLLKLLSQSAIELGILIQGFSEEAIAPPKPLPNQVRSGWNISKHLPSQRAFKGLTVLATTLTELLKPADQRNLFTANCVSLLLHTDFTWSLEIKQAKDLPDSPVLVLDATGTHVIEQWQSAITDRPVSLEEVVVQGSAPASAIHIESKAFTKGMCVEKGQVDKFCADRIDSVLARLVSEVRSQGCKSEFEHCTLALLTHRPIYDACMGIAKYPYAEQVKQRVDAICEEMNMTVLFGYYGRHDRGTNEFEAVDGLAVCGDPRGNLGDAEHDAKLIDVSLDKSYSGKTMATAVQAINRARHLRRETSNRVVLMYVGDHPPEIRGFEWETEDMSRRAYKTLNDDALKLCRYIAQNDGVLSSFSFKTYPLDIHPSAPQIDNKAVHAQKLNRAMKAVANELGWTSIDLVLENNRRQVVYSSSTTYAQAWVNCGCPVGFDLDYENLFL